MTEVSVLPEPLLRGMRDAKRKGMSDQQIEAVLDMVAGLYEIMEKWDRDELLVRVKAVLPSIR